MELKSEFLPRNRIIETLKQALEPLPYIYAFWLEGADANGSLDSYSDYDFWVDFEDSQEAEAIEAVENALKSLSPLDFQYIMEHPHPKIRQRIYHLEGTGKFLMIDFCWQLHSRDMEGFAFVKGDRVENALVLFDKAQVIRFTEEEPPLPQKEKESLLRECDYRYSQHCRVVKYILRGEFPEALIYYQRYVIEPLVLLLRLQYTPRHTDYGMVHISHHIPSPPLRRLENLLSVSSLDDIRERMPLARYWFQELRGKF